MQALNKTLLVHFTLILVQMYPNK